MQSNSAFFKMLSRTEALLHGEMFDDERYDLKENIRTIEYKIHDLKSEIKHASIFNAKEKDKLKKEMRELQIALIKYQSDYDSKYGDEDIKGAYREIEEILNELK